MPLYGEGAGGWRDRFGAEANLLAAKGAGHCQGGLFTWMAEQARGLVAAGVIAGVVPAE